VEVRSPRDSTPTRARSSRARSGPSVSRRPASPSAWTARVAGSITCSSSAVEEREVRGGIDEERRGRDDHHQPPKQIHLSRRGICPNKRSHPSKSLMLLWTLPLTRRRSTVRSRQHPPLKLLFCLGFLVGRFFGTSQSACYRCTNPASRVPAIRPICR
jgi:hypothetical protein